MFAARFSEFALTRNLTHPALADDPSHLRAVVLVFRAFFLTSVVPAREHQVNGCGSIVGTRRSGIRQGRELR